MTSVMYLFSSVVATKLVGILTTFLIAKIMLPGNYGLWMTLILIPTYLPILLLGTIEALLKQYPFFIGKGDFKAANKIERNTLGAVTMVSIFILFNMVLIGNIIAIPKIEHLYLEIKLIIISTVISFYSAFYYYRFSARQEFKIVSFIEVARSIINSITMITMTYFYGLIGAIIAGMICEALVLALSLVISKKNQISLSIEFNLKEIVNLVKIGFPITIIWWLFIVQFSIDRMISINFLGRDSTGYYSLGTNIQVLLIMIPLLIGRVLYPKINEEIGKETSAKQIEKYIIFPAKILSLLIPFIIGIIVIALPVLYILILPKYKDGLRSAQILIFGSFFVCLIRSVINYLIAINMQSKLLLYIAISLVVGTGISLALIRLGYGINGIAIGGSLGSCTMSVLTWITSYKKLNYSIQNVLSGFGGLYSPFILCLVFAIGIICFNLQLKLNLITSSIIGVGEFTVLYFGAMFIIPGINKDFRLIHLFVNENIVMIKQKMGLA